ncbi:MAG: GMC family oxidoreductase N-terminal domain-containing protein, partial [Saprospiraceae bacterium]
RLLAEGAAQLGHRAIRIPHNMVRPPSLDDGEAWRLAGYSCLGDRFDIKQGPTQTFLKDAVQSGARLAPRTCVLRILIERGAAVGVVAAVQSSREPDAPARILNIRAERVVVSAGALHTPVLLQKSGLKHPQIGRNLYLHPVAIVPGYYPEPTHPWQGPMMTTLIDAWARLDRNWGVRIENPPVHPGLTAAAMIWESGPDFKEAMRRLPFLSAHICLTRDRFGGQVRAGKRSGQPIVTYRLNPYDRAHLIRGMQESARLHAAAGAEQISILHQSTPLHWRRNDDIERLVAQIPQLDWSRNRFGLFSAHQMGTCRMGGRSDCPVKPNGETREARRLYVADTSLFPSASGANPMLSAQALAWYVAGHIAG